jgi:cell division cycle 2-like protein
MEWTGSPTESTWPELFKIGSRFSIKFPKFSRPSKRVFKRLPARAQDLLESLLQLNFNERPTAREVLRHPYFTE